MPAGPFKRRENDHLPDDATIRELLRTWQVRQMRGEVSVPPPPDDGRDDPEWSWKYEQQYGQPKRDDRKSVLQSELNVLADDGKDICAMVAALQQIKHKAFENAMDVLQIDVQREHIKEADIVRRKLTEWLPRAIRLHQRLNPDNLEKALRFRRMYEEMLTALTFDEPMTEQQRDQRDWLFDPSLLEKVPLRRQKQTNPHAQLVKYAHELLSGAGVPRDHHGNLLWAIGLVEENGNLPRRNFSRS